MGWLNITIAYALPIGLLCIVVPSVLPLYILGLAGLGTFILADLLSRKYSK